MFSIEGKTETELIKGAARAGIPLIGLSSYSQAASLPQALVLGFAGLMDHQLEEAVSALRQAWGV